MYSAGKRIAFVIPSIDYGGAELQVINQINYLVKKQAGIFLIVIDKINVLEPEIALPSENILTLNFPIYKSYAGSILKAYTLINRISNFLVENQIDAVIANLPFSHYLMRIVKLKAIFNQKFCLLNYHHSLQYIESPLDTTFKRFFNYYNSGLARFADDRNIFISEAAKNNISENIYIKQPVVIFNAVPDKRVDTTLTINYFLQKQIHPTDYTIVLPGRLNVAKGHLFFIKVLSQFIERNNLTNKQIKIIFAGGGNLEKEIVQQLQQANLESYVHITGFVNNDLLLSIMNDCNLVIIPSIFEGFGNVALEALMLNKLILASDAGGLKEIIRHKENGYLFKASDEADCIDKLSFLYNNKFEIIINKQQVEDDFNNRFSFSSHIQKLLKEINSCAE